MNYPNYYLDQTKPMHKAVAAHYRRYARVVTIRNDLTSLRGGILKAKDTRLSENEFERYSCERANDSERQQKSFRESNP